MNYKKIKPQKLYEQVATLIEQNIANQKILPGGRLDSVEQLAKNFSVGRSAIREALTSLQAKGILEIRQGEGTFVRKLTAEDITLHVPNTAFSMQDLKQIFEVRKVLELGLIENAATRRTTEQLQIMHQAIEKMAHALTNAEESSDADFLFHTTLAEAANNSLLVSMVQNVSKPISAQIKHTRELLAHSNVNALIELHDEHLAILDALEKSDAEKAKTAMATHLATVEKLLFQ